MDVSKGPKRPPAEVMKERNPPEGRNSLFFLRRGVERRVARILECFVVLGNILLGVESTIVEVLEFGTGRRDENGCWNTEASFWR